MEDGMSSLWKVHNMPWSSSGHSHLYWWTLLMKVVWGSCNKRTMVNFDSCHPGQPWCFKAVLKSSWEFVTYYFYWWQESLTIQTLVSVKAEFHFFFNSWESESLKVLIIVYVEWYLMDESVSSWCHGSTGCPLLLMFRFAESESCPPFLFVYQLAQSLDLIWFFNELI